MTHNDDTPSSEKMKYVSGELPSWLGMVFERTDRIQRSVDHMRDDLTEHVGDDKVMRSDVNSLIKRRDSDDQDSRGLNLGTKLAIIGSVISPIAVIAFETLKH